MKYSEDLIEDVIQGLDDNSFEIRYYLDKENEKIIMISKYDDENDENDYDYDPDNFVFIDSIPSYEKYNVMEEFAAMQNDRLAELLEVALAGKGAFRRFKDVLYRFPEE